MTSSSSPGFLTYSEDAPLRVLFVCLGNICRSPAAEILFNAALKKEGLDEHVYADSCGMGGWHIGQKPDLRMLAALKRHGYEWGGHVARQFSRLDFSEFDLIIPQDESNRADILSLAQTNQEKAKVIPMSRWFPEGAPFQEVPDPYWDGARGFDTVVELLETACARLAQEIRKRENRALVP